MWVRDACPESRKFFSERARTRWKGPKTLRPPTFRRKRQKKQRNARKLKIAKTSRNVVPEALHPASPKTRQRISQRNLSQKRLGKAHKKKIRETLRHLKADAKTRLCTRGQDDTKQKTETPREVDTTFPTILRALPVLQVKRKCEYSTKAGCT